MTIEHVRDPLESCAFPGCGEPVIVTVNQGGACRDHIDWRITSVVSPARQAMRALRAGRNGTATGYLAQAAGLLRAAAAQVRPADPTLADSCDAVALQAEDLAEYSARAVGQTGEAERAT